jgi:hypothetical protein
VLRIVCHVWKCIEEDALGRGVPIEDPVKSIVETDTYQLKNEPIRSLSPGSSEVISQGEQQPSEASRKIADRSAH